MLEERVVYAKGLLHLDKEKKSELTFPLGGELAMWAETEEHWAGLSSWLEGPRSSPAPTSTTQTAKQYGRLPVPRTDFHYYLLN